MNANWHPDVDTTPTPTDVEFMALTLEGRHGVYAAEVADFFADLRGAEGDAGRSWAWAGVAALVRQRFERRVQPSGGEAG